MNGSMWKLNVGTRDGGPVDREARHFKPLDITLGRRGRWAMGAVVGENEVQVGGQADQRSLGTIFDID